MGRIASRHLLIAGLAAITTSVTVWSPLPASAAAATMTLSSTSGPSGGGNPIIATATATAAVPAPFPLTGMPTVQFQYSGTGSSACAAKAKDPTQIANTGATTTAGFLTVDPDDVQQISTTKLAFKVPSKPYPAKTFAGADSTINVTGLALREGQTTAKWFVCVYDSPSTTSSTLLATATYTLNVRPKIARILPMSSPAGGGQTITVAGVGFGTGTTATLGGTPMTGIKLAANGSSFTAIAPAHAPADDLALVVNTPRGPVSSTDPDNNGEPEDDKEETADAPLTFVYSNGITVTPNNAPAGSKVSLDVKGVGFSALSFNKPGAGTPTDNKAHVFLVRDAYDPATNRGVQECTNVLVISNVELVCSLDLAADRLKPEDSSTVTGKPVTEGTYTLTVVATGETSANAAAVAATIVSTGSTFVVGPY